MRWLKEFSLVKILKKCVKENDLNRKNMQWVPFPDEQETHS